MTEETKVEGTTELRSTTETMKTWAMTGLVVVAIVMAYMAGVGRGVREAGLSMSSQSADKALTVEERLAALEKSKADHEAALNGAAARFQQITQERDKLAQAHDGLVQAVIQNDRDTRGMIMLMERATASYVGESKWKSLVEAAKAPVPAKKEEPKKPAKK